QRAYEAAVRQGATRWRRLSELLLAYGSSDRAFGDAVESVGRTSPWNLTYVADLIVNRIDELSDAAHEAVGAAALRHPGRWRFVLRQRIDANDTSLRAAMLLDRIGDRGD